MAGQDGLSGQGGGASGPESPFRGQICPAVVGPTAVGKTSLVTALAAHGPLEVISLDSRQIYRGLRIGTAQPTAEELAVCPHHLIDFVDPDEKYSGARFRTDFARVYQEIRARGGWPLLVGGAGMYLKALREGFMDIPGHSQPRLQEARAQVARWSPEQLRQKLRQVDPASEARIHENDLYRAQRAMEIYLISGRSMTALTAEHRPTPCLGLAFPAHVLHRPVPELDARIARRTEAMLAEGWIEETEAALKKHQPQGPGLGSIGYREIVRHLGGELGREELVPAIVLATRQYAKRQRTWFRHIPESWNHEPEDEGLVGVLRGYWGGES
ncbi:tRNA (adenosine(37)-N6)-dimethylallyltransferase MiaA [bacterium DOLZORAL124_64_63]|nr:MAG: tRNA (adenosine(37)-N6)-dimethylallyltransferase MiaA [bacterium DOLZORAL124_64_63]